jgi:hypothetical protein
MSSTQDYRQLADPELFAERRRVRKQLEALPPRHAGRALLAQAYDALTQEFDRRARSAWQSRPHTAPHTAPRTEGDETVNIQTGRDQERANGFQFSPSGPFLLRDYSNEPAAGLTALSGLLAEILTRHRHLIPGSMNRLMVQWHADLHRAISPPAGGARDEADPRCLP